MPIPGVALERLGFLTIGLFDGNDPARGHRTTLEMIEFGERLGFDNAYLATLDVLSGGRITRA
jgi:hypothetical protein